MDIRVIDSGFREEFYSLAEDASFCLDGIAIRWDHQKKGYGSALLQEFVKAARAYGCKTVTVGSAGGYVEHYYIENGFVPIQYKYFDEEGIHIEKTYRDMADYENYTRLHADGFVVLEYSRET